MPTLNIPASALRPGESSSGSVNQVIRVGNAVHRPTGHWTPAVHELLRHLEQVGFDGSPRVLGLDEEGREILTYLHGEVAMRPWPEWLLADVGMVLLGRFLRRYHDAVQGFVPSPGTIWRVTESAWREGLIIRHGDLGPWNFVWKDDDLIGLIDWDFAEPGTPIEDVAQLAWNAVPLGPPKRCEAAGVPSGESQAHRLAVLCHSYGGADVEAVVDAVTQLQRRELARTINLGGQGIAPWCFFLERGDVWTIEEDMEWLAAGRGWLKRDRASE